MATEGTFVSNITGKTLTYTNWNVGEPSNFNDEDCINTKNESGLWNDYPCDSALPAVCEIESEFIETGKISIKDPRYNEENP